MLTPLPLDLDHPDPILAANQDHVGGRKEKPTQVTHSHKLFASTIG